MKKGSSILVILSALLLILALIAILIIVLPPVLNPPDFEKAMHASREALNTDSKLAFRHKILQAGRSASGADDWRQILALSASAILSDSPPSQYKLFTVLANRAVIRNPGHDNFLASWVWGLLRSGKLKKAVLYAEGLNDTPWRTLKSEIRIQSGIGNKPKDWKAFSEELQGKLEPDFFSCAASLTDSAELAADAALMYMQIGESEKAYELAWQIMNKQRTWSNPNRFFENGISGAMARIAYDNNNFADAGSWLEESAREGKLNWEDLQLLGDINWNNYKINRNLEQAENAMNFWSEAITLLPARFPERAWMLWLNSAVVLNELGLRELARERLENALSLFPEREQVKAAWAIEHSEDYPSLANRLLETNSITENPVLAFTAMRINPAPGNPRAYEAKLWEIFEVIMQPEAKIFESDAKAITSFLLNDVRMKADYSSISIVVSRYLSTQKNSDWITAWILASDSAQNMAIIDLLATEKNGESNYSSARRRAREGKDWKLLYDLALFVFFSVNNLNTISLDYIDENSDNSDVNEAVFEAVFEAAVLSWLLRYPESVQDIDSNLRFRINSLENSRGDLKDLMQAIGLRGSIGRKTRFSVNAAIKQKKRELLEQAIDDLLLAKNEKKEEMHNNRIANLENLIMNALNSENETGYRVNVDILKDGA